MLLEIPALNEKLAWVSLISKILMNECCITAVQQNVCEDPLNVNFVAVKEKSATSIDNHVPVPSHNAWKYPQHFQVESL
ncbi:hypothetical protein KFK09_011425 [Dendrobium nobile]|uniref:Uncharacterized protein n=1 Tax=Dendrobium nobile TaxID=94219 RepID=A0A8T3BCU6_DENNO|nr:hypothetical protein KFK09_011425 [Dendrobium nobile]